MCIKRLPRLSTSWIMTPPMWRSPLTLIFLSTCRSVTKTDSCHEPSPYITFSGLGWPESTNPGIFLVILLTLSWCLSCQMVLAYVTPVTLGQLPQHHHFFAKKIVQSQAGTFSLVNLIIEVLVQGSGPLLNFLSEMESNLNYTSIYKLFEGSWFCLMVK